MTMRIGVVGCGNISETYLPVLRSMPTVDLVACSDLSTEVAQWKAERFGIRALTTDEMLTSNEVDFIVNLTVPNAHYEITRTALLSGKHVYSEKPLAVTLEQANELVSIAQQSGVRLGCAPDTYLGGAGQIAGRAIDREQIGRVTSGAISYVSIGMEHWHPNPSFYYKEGGGPVLDMAPYYVTALVSLLGPVKRVFAMANKGRESRKIGSGPLAGDVFPVEVPTNYNAVLEMDNGATVSLTASWDIWRSDRNHIELYGQEGTLTLPDPNWHGGRVTCSLRGDAWIDLNEEAVPFKNPNGRDAAGNPIANYRGIGIADMVEAIGRNRPHRASAELAVHVLEILEQIIRSARTHEQITLSTTCVRPMPFGTDDQEWLNVVSAPYIFAVTKESAL